MSEDEEVGPWTYAWLKCLECGNTHVSVHPVSIHGTLMECPNCYQMTAGVYERPRRKVRVR